ncbi:MAG: ketopantoate reductase family protein [Vicinamibacteria bacterium]
MPDDDWPRIAVVGAGAVGCYFGGMLALAGAPVTFLGRVVQVEALRTNGLTIESVRFTRTVAVEASTEMSSAAFAPVVLLCVKATDTEEAAKALAPYLAKEALVVSLQNGVDNVSRIRAAAGFDAVPAVVYVGAEVTEPGRVKHTARGDLVLGNVPDLAKLFARAEIPVKLSENIEGDLWMKLMQNCAYNALSALGRARYGRLVRNPWTRDLMRKVVDEVVAVGKAREIRFPDVDLVAATWKLGEGMEHATSSTAQDIARGRRSEIDSLNGYVARLGEKLGIPTPVNRTLHALVKLLEEGSS